MSDEIPERATIREEYRTRGSKVYGPYKKAYWKENGKLRWRYIGESLDDYQTRLKWKRQSKETHVPVTFIMKLQFMHNYNFDPFVESYLQKLKKGKCKIDWGYRQVREHMEDIFVKMGKVGLDWTDREKVRKYLAYQQYLQQREPHTEDSYPTHELGNHDEAIESLESAPSQP